MTSRNLNGGEEKSEGEGVEKKKEREKSPRDKDSTV